MKLSSLFLITISLIVFWGTVWLKRSREELLRKEPEEFSFVVVGHVYPQYEALESVIKQAEEEKVSFIILTGDLINGGSKSFEGKWQDFETIMGQTKTPFYIAPGNHDVGSGEKRRVFEERFDQTYRSFTFKNSKFILLNSCDYSKGFEGDVDQEQLEFLRKEYADPLEFDNIFLFLHHPLWLKDSSLTNGVYNFSSWEEKVLPIIKGKTKYVFAGDTCTVFHTKKDGISYFVNGFDREMREELPFFLQVKVKGREVRMEVKPALSDAQHKIYLVEEKELE